MSEDDIGKVMAMGRAIARIMRLDRQAASAFMDQLRELAKAKAKEPA